MKKIIFTTTILVLFVSCTVTKNTARHSVLVSASPAIDKGACPLVKAHNDENTKSSEVKQEASSTSALTQEKADYNPYRYEEKKAAQEQIRADGYKGFLAMECDASQLQIFMEKYNTTKDVLFLYGINGCGNCPEIIDFAIDLVNTSPDKEARKIAIVMLGSRMYYDVIPLLFNHVKKDISSDEKIAVASALAILGKKKEALEIFDCNCYNMNDMDDDCTLAYLEFFDKETAIKYFEHYFNKPETQLKAASWLAGLGVYDKTFPLFVEFLENNTTYERGTVYSLCGLAAIGTEEAFEIIKKYARDDGSVDGGLISGTAIRILNRIKEGREKK